MNLIPFLADGFFAGGLAIVAALIVVVVFSC